MPDAAVLVATVRALKMHGGLAKEDLATVSYSALEAGLANLGRHIENLRLFGLPVVVAINRFTTDTSAELTAIEAYCARLGVEVAVCTHWAEGGRGAEALARAVTEITARERSPSPFCTRTICPSSKRSRPSPAVSTGPQRVDTTRSVRNQLTAWEAAGFGNLPVCMAKTQYSFSTDPGLLGAPEGHVVRLREVRLAAGAGFVVAICGDIMTMPGLPRRPAAEIMHLNAAGQIEGLS